MAALAILVPAVKASTITFFRTPSSNIACAFFGPGHADLRCDIRQTDNAPKPRPKSCEFDYGHSYGLKPHGRGFRRCVSDSVADPGARVIAYGHSIKRYGMRCTSRRSGLRCVNHQGHGFSLSRQRQKVF